MSGLRRSSAFVESNRESLLDSLHQLDELEIEQFAQYDGVCHSCHSPYYGILDESKLTLPLGGVEAFFRRPVRGVAIASSSSGTHYDVGYTSYEIRQSIVRSGLFSREQLSSVLRLNQHHLEVAEVSFRDIRPRRCECDFGESYTEDELLALALMDDPITDLMPVEADFIAGKPVRTGFRRRSPDARLRRRHRAKKAWLEPVRVIRTIPIVHPKWVNDNLGVVNNTVLELVFNFLPPKSRQLHRSKPDKYKPALARKSPGGLIAPIPGEKKYFYFLRKRRFCRLSAHHPLGGSHHLR